MPVVTQICGFELRTWLFPSSEKNRVDPIHLRQVDAPAKIGIKIVIDSACVQVSYNTYT